MKDVLSQIILGAVAWLWNKLEIQYQKLIEKINKLREDIDRNTGDCNAAHCAIRELRQRVTKLEGEKHDVSRIVDAREGAEHGDQP